MPGLRCIAITSNPASVAELDFALSTQPEVSRFTAVANVSEAIETIKQSVVDAVFVDVEPLSNQQVEELRHAPWAPALVGLGSRAELAVVAFDLGAVDFILSPISRDQVRRAVQRLGRCSCCRTTSHITLRIPIQRGEQLGFVDARDIHFIEADGDYTLVHSAAGVDACKQSLTSLEEKLQELGFIRIHRKWLVSMTKVEALNTHDGQLAVQVAGQQLPVARRTAAQVRSRLH